MKVLPTTSQRAQERLDCAVGLALASVIAAVSVMYTCYQVGHLDGIRESGAFLTELPQR